MLVKEIINRVQNLYEKGVASRSSRLTPHFIFSVISSVRARFLTQKINNKQKLSDWNYQVLNCVELIKIPIEECPCLPKLGCTILRSKHKIPKALSGYDFDFIKSVTSIDGSVVYSKTDWQKRKYLPNIKYGKNLPDYFVLNDYIYVNYNKGAKFLKIILVAENVLDVLNFNNLCEKEKNSKCDTISFLDLNFPIDVADAQSLIDMVVENTLKMYLNNREDHLNDSKDAKS